MGNATALMIIVMRRAWSSAAKPTANTRRAAPQSSIMPIANEHTCSAGIEK
jgi:hypothetical protein